MNNHAYPTTQKKEYLKMKTVKKTFGMCGQNTFIDFLIAILNFI